MAYETPQSATAIRDSILAGKQSYDGAIGA
eukprot:SAG11_NODE_13320_length_660_cov_1.162210_1_plen_29_part_01